MSRSWCGLGIFVCAGWPTDPHVAIELCCVSYYEKTTIIGGRVEPSFRHLLPSWRRIAQVDKAERKRLAFSAEHRRCECEGEFTMPSVYLEELSAVGAVRFPDIP